VALLNLQILPCTVKDKVPFKCPISTGAIIKIKQKYKLIYAQLNLLSPLFPQLDQIIVTNEGVSKW
jgi:hypothetical protein